MAGVSESTVSRALSGSSLVAEQTRERIVNIARAANFSVNQQARNLALGQAHTIEVIFPIEPGTLQQVSDPFFVDMLAALTDELAERRFDVLLSKSTPWDRERPGCAFLGGRADGVIFVGQGRHRSDIRDFARTHKKVVVWGAVEADDDYCVVGSDNVHGGFLAVDHLHEGGRRSVAFLGDRSLPEIERRYEGYRRGLFKHGLRADPSLDVAAPFDIEKARAAAARLVEQYPGFDAIFAASDMIALAAIAELRERGIRVPEDVCVVGFDGIPAGAHVDPALTTIRQNVRDGGEVMIEHLFRLMGGAASPSTTLPVELVVRRSTRPREPRRDSSRRQ